MGLIGKAARLAVGADRQEHELEATRTALFAEREKSARLSVKVEERDQLLAQAIQLLRVSAPSANVSPAIWLAVTQVLSAAERLK